ncbi:MAG: hypothetical protein ACSHX8_01615 [Opitutaceae bacterium]
MLKKLRTYCSFYLPRPFRRWFIYLPINTFFIIGICIVGLIIKAAFISADKLFESNELPVEVKQQFQRMEWMVHNSAARGRLDIYTDYTEICGEGIEWNYGFYVFYAMSLEALVEQHPEKTDFAAKQIEICTRLMMQLPINANDEEIQKILNTPGNYAASLVSGYQCLVLGIRHKITGDSLYDETILEMSRALAKELRVQLVSSGQVYTSDQSTQLHAIWRADQALGTDHSELFDLWIETMTSKFLEPESRLLFSIVSINPDRIDSAARATSVIWSTIFLADIYPEFAKQQYKALRKDRMRRVINLAAIAEYPELNPLDFGDMDSGPMLLGISPSATGFGLCSHKLFGTQADYTRCYRIFELFGLPKNDHTGKYYRMGNGMGDAILLYSKIVDSK